MVRRFHVATGNEHCASGKLVAIRHNLHDRGALQRTTEHGVRIDTPSVRTQQGEACVRECYVVTKDSLS